MSELSQDEVHTLVRTVEAELDNIRQGGADLNNIGVTARTAVYGLVESIQKLIAVRDR